MTFRDDEIKEKIQRCVKQGHIDPEDFKGVSIFLLLRFVSRYHDLTACRTQRRTS